MYLDTRECMNSKGTQYFEVEGNFPPLSTDLIACSLDVPEERLSDFYLMAASFYQS